MTARHPTAPLETVLPPHSIESEQSVIGGLLLDNSSWERISDIVGEADFYRDDHRRIFRHIRQLIEAGKPADVVTVFATIEVSHEVEQTGGMGYLGEIANATPSAANISGYAEAVRDRAVRRKLIAAANSIAGRAYGRGSDLQALLDSAEHDVFAIADQSANGRQSIVTMRESLADFTDHLQDLYDRDGPCGLETGFVDLDRQLLGLQPGDLVILAGRPSMGKTALALNIVEHAGVALKKPVFFASLEMTHRQLTGRLISAIGQIPGDVLRTARLSDQDWDRATAAIGQIHDAPIYIDETGAIDALQLRSRARRLHRDVGGLGLVVVDYLQLMSSAGDGAETRASAIGEITRALKALAKELQVPVIALSQLSRKVEERNDKRPLMSDLRESGAIEQDADIILMMYREEYYKQDTPEKGIAEVIIGKHRNGPTGTVKLAFRGEFTQFKSLANGVTKPNHGGAKSAAAPHRPSGSVWSGPGWIPQE
jgi:replicative DNA helicase